MAKPQQEAGQQRDGPLTRLTVPTLDAERIHLRRAQGLALVEAMPNEGVYDATLRTFTRAGENQPRTTFNVLVDKASKLGYNDHVLQPDPKDAVKLNPSSRAVPFSRMKVTAYLILG